MDLGLEKRKESQVEVKNYTLKVATKEKIKVYHDEEDDTYYLEIYTAYKLGYIDEEDYNKRKNVGNNYFWIPYKEVIYLKNYYDVVIIPLPRLNNNLNRDLDIKLKDEKNNVGKFNKMKEFYEEKMYSDGKIDEIKADMNANYNKIELDDSINIHK